MFQNSLRPPAREAHDSQSCAITRGSVPNDMVAFRSQHSSAGPGFYEQQFATTKYPATKMKLVPREGVTPAWNEEIKNLLSQCRCSHILIEDGPPTLHRFMQEAPSIELQLFLMQTTSLALKMHRASYCPALLRLWQAWIQ